MKRHPHLQALSREHHGALKLARDARLAALSADAAEVERLAKRVVARFADELEPHFVAEESDVLPGLGDSPLVAQTLAEHAELRTLADRLRSPDAATLLRFADLLNAHVRFEERQLFEAVQAAGSVADGRAPRGPSAIADAGRAVRGVLVAALLFAALAAPEGDLYAADSPPPWRVEAERLDGTRFSLADQQGAITVLVVWSPDSLASRKSLGEAQRFAAGYASRGVRTLAAAVDGDAESLQAFLRRRQLDLPAARLTAHDLGPLREQDLPAVFVFDRQGTLRATHGGLFRLRDLEHRVAPLLAE